jgi:hypothetical protein
MEGFTGSPQLQKDLVLGGDQESGQGFKGAVLYGAGLSTVYDSNFFLSEDDPEAELINALSGAVMYFSDPEGGAPASIVANYSPVFQSFLENPDNNGIDQSGNVKMTLTGAKTVVLGYLNLSQGSGTDPVIGEFVSESLLSAGIEASYQLAPKTSLNGSFAVSTSDFGTGSLEGANIYSTYLSGSWMATENLSLGPEVQYNKALSDNSGTRDAWQLLIQGQYQVGQRIQISGSIGMDYSTNSREEGGGSAGLTGSLSASYSINEKLSWSGSVLYITVPSPDEVDYVINNLAISTEVSRKLLKAEVDLGLSLNVASYEAVGPTAGPLDDESIVNLYVNYSRGLFQDRLSLVGGVYYALSDGQSNWNQFQLSLGLNTQF